MNKSFITTCSAIGYLVLLLSVFLPSSAQSTTDLFVKRTTNGSNVLTISNLELVLGQLLYLEKKQNNLYQSFWEREGLKSPDDMYVRLVPSRHFSNGLVVVYSLSPALQAEDPNLEVHERISSMMYNYLYPYSRQYKWLKWLTGVERGYTSDKKLTNEEKLARYELIDPPEDQVADETEPDSNATARVSLSTQEYIWHRLKLAKEDVEPIYRSFLNLSGLEYGRHADFDIRIDSVRSNSIVIYFMLEPEAVTADPGLTGHKNMAKTFINFLHRKSEPFRPKWLLFEAKADTSHYRHRPVSLYLR